MLEELKKATLKKDINEVKTQLELVPSNINPALITFANLGIHRLWASDDSDDEGLENRGQESEANQILELYSIWMQKKQFSFKSLRINSEGDDLINYLYEHQYPPHLLTRFLDLIAPETLKDVNWQTLYDASYFDVEKISESEIESIIYTSEFISALFKHQAVQAPLNIKSIFKFLFRDDYISGLEDNQFTKYTEILVKYYSDFNKENLIGALYPDLCDLMRYHLFLGNPSLFSYLPPSERQEYIQSVSNEDAKRFLDHLLKYMKETLGIDVLRGFTCSEQPAVEEAPLRSPTYYSGSLLVKRELNENKNKEPPAKKIF